MKFVQTAFSVLVGNLLFQSCGNILSFPLILVFVSWYIKKKTVVASYCPALGKYLTVVLKEKYLLHPF